MTYTEITNATHEERMAQIGTLTTPQMIAYRNIAMMDAGFMNGTDDTMRRDLAICETLLKQRGERIPRGKKVMAR